MFEFFFIDDKYNDFIEVNCIEDVWEWMRMLWKLIWDFLGYYYEMFKFFVGYFKIIVDYFEKNKMEFWNLVLVFGLILVRIFEDNMIDMVIYMFDCYKIVEILI